MRYLWLDDVTLQLNEWLIFNHGETSWLSFFNLEHLHVSGIPRAEMCDQKYQPWVIIVEKLGVNYFLVWEVVHWKLSYFCGSLTHIHLRPRPLSNLQTMTVCQYFNSLIVSQENPFAIELRLPPKPILSALAKINEFNFEGFGLKLLFNDSLFCHLFNRHVKRYLKIKGLRIHHQVIMVYLAPCHRWVTSSFLSSFLWDSTKISVDPIMMRLFLVSSPIDLSSHIVVILLGMTSCAADLAITHYYI